MVHRMLHRKRERQVTTADNLTHVMKAGGEVANHVVIAIDAQAQVIIFDAARIPTRPRCREPDARHTPAFT